MKAEKILLWLKCTIHHAYGLLNWRWTVSPLPGIPSLDITTRGMQVMLPRALEQPLLLPKDMEAYRHFNQQKLVMSLKRDLVMVSSLIYCTILKLIWQQKSN